MPTIIELLTTLVTLWVVLLGFAMIIRQHVPYLAWSGRLVHHLLAMPFKVLAWGASGLANAVSPKPKKKQKKRRR